MVLRLLFLVFCVELCQSVEVPGFKLKQVLILSRHNVRYPIDEHLQDYTPKPWPKPAGPRSYLTPRGIQMEENMGEYFSEWFKKHQFLTGDCPDNNTVYVYANNVERTKATARAFVKTAFKDCNVTVHHKDHKDEDLLFAPTVRNTTEAFKEMVFEEIYRKLDNNYDKLRVPFALFNEILDIKNSEVCKKDGICDLNKANVTIKYKFGEEVWLNGPMSIGNSVLDFFLMSYYNGIPLKDIAWGQLTTPEKWKLATEFTRQEHSIKYATVAPDFGKPLVNYLTEIFKKYDEMPKLMLLVGHDYNLNAVLTLLQFKQFHLPYQYEPYPIGGKIVFQRWTGRNKKDYLKIEFVYPSWSQIRNEVRFSLESPPQRVPLQLTMCKTDRYGFCSWSEFVNKLHLI